MTPEKPHGLDYRLTLHAHPIREGAGPGARTRIEYDHKHRGERVRFYEYVDAVGLLSDFWTEVHLVLKERTLRP